MGQVKKPRQVILHAFLLLATPVSSLPHPLRNKPPCSKLQGINVTFLLSPHPNLLPKERGLWFYPVASSEE